MCSRCARTTSSEETCFVRIARASQPAGAPMMSLIYEGVTLYLVPGVDIEHFYARAYQVPEVFRTAGERRKGTEVHRHHCGDAEQRHGLGCALGTHRVEATDRQECHVELSKLGDERHVAEHVGVAGEIDREAVFELDHEAVRPAVQDLVAIRDAARVLGVDEGDLDSVDVDGSSLVRADDAVGVDSLRTQPGTNLEVGHD